MANFISEDQIELALLQRPQHLGGYDALNCFTAATEDLNDGSGRSDKREVILAERLTRDCGTGFSHSGLTRMARFYDCLPEEPIVATLSQQLSCLADSA